MNEKQVEELLKQVKQHIPVNSALKEELRQSFTVPAAASRWSAKRRRWQRFVSVAAVVLLLAGVMNWFASKDVRVEAASLQINEYVSSAELISGKALAAAEYNDTVYLSVSGKGIFAYNRSGFRQLTDHEAEELKISPDGKRLLWGNKGTIGVFNIEDRSWNAIKQGGDGKQYKQPSWIDDQSILYVEQNASEERDSADSPKIMEMRLDKQTVKELAAGTFPSFVYKSHTLVFQKDTGEGPQVVRLDLRSHRMKVIDNGREPNVSSLGQYVAYVKVEENPASSSMMSQIRSGIDNVWISDIDGKTKRAVTSNISQIDAAEKGYYTVPRDGAISSQATNNDGLYYFNLPVWGKDSVNLYVFKQRKDDPASTLTRIVLSSTGLGPQGLVASFNQAMIYRNYDYAQSLLIKPSSELMMGSNPRQISYKITNSGTVDGMDYIDTEAQWVYTANPYILSQNVRYNIVNDPKGYKIDSIQILDAYTVKQIDNGFVQREHGSTKEPLFTIDDIPKKLLPKGSSRIASLYELSDSNHLLFAVQAMKDTTAGQQSYVQAFDYDSSNKQFHLLDQLTSLYGAGNVGVENMTVSSKGQYAALLLNSDIAEYRTDVMVLDLKNNQKFSLSSLLEQTDIKSVRTDYWNGEELHVTVESGDGLFVRYKWDTVSKVLQVL